MRCAWCRRCCKRRAHPPRRYLINIRSDPRPLSKAVLQPDTLIKCGSSHVEQGSTVMKFDPSPFSLTGSTHLPSEGGSASPLTAPLPSRRKLLKSFCACCAGFAIAPAGLSLLAAADRAEAAMAQGTIRVRHLPDGCVSHLLLAKTRGMFAKAGIHAQLTQFNGPDQDILALQDGNVDVAHHSSTTT